MVIGAALARKRIGGGAMFLFSVGASAPLTVLLAVVTVFASTGVVGVPLSFLLLGAGLGLLTVGFVYMSKYVPHPAPFYGLAAAGISRPAGVAAGFVGLLSYTAIHQSLYGPLGVTLQLVTGVDWRWWAVMACVMIAVLGQLRVDINAKVFAWTLLAEIAVVTAFDVTAFTRPAGGSIDWSPLTAGSLFTTGVSGVFALVMASFTGYETTVAYSEEARSASAMKIATFGSLAFITVFYTVSTLAVITATGVSRVSAAARDDPYLPLSILSRQFGPLMLALATLLLVSSIFAAMLSFHNTTVRYGFGMGREGVLPARFAQTGTGLTGGAPTWASWLHSGFSGTVLLAVIVLRLPPLTVFAWLAALSAVGVLTLLLSSTVASFRFFRDGKGSTEGRWVRQIAPVTGGIAGVTILAMTMDNLDSLLGVPPGSSRPWAVPSLVAAVWVLGLSWGAVLRLQGSHTYHGIGQGQPDPHAPEPRLAELDL